MGILTDWESRIEELAKEGRHAELRILACECLRLGAPLFEDPSIILDLVSFAERYRKYDEWRKMKSSQEISTYEYIRKTLYQTKKDLNKESIEFSATTKHEVDIVMRNGPKAARMAINSMSDYNYNFTKLAHRFQGSYVFARYAFSQLNDLINAHLEYKLGNKELLVRVFDEIRMSCTMNKCEINSLLDDKFPAAAKKLCFLLSLDDNTKTFERLLIFRSFIIHKSFSHVAKDLNSRVGEDATKQDHSGPASKVKKLGETLGIQLTYLSPNPGRSSTELTAAGEALCDWIRLHPTLFV